MNTEHWDVAAVAEHLGLGASYVRRNIVELAGFPRAATRWPAEEVRQWAGERRRAAPCTPVVDAPDAPKRGGGPVADCLRAAVRQAKKRALKLGRPMNIEFAHVLDMHTRQAGRCAVSGIPFSFDDVAGSAARPFAPSIDRIDSGQGYLVGNVRLVCHCINLMMNEWGDTIYKRVAEAARAQS